MPVGKKFKSLTAGELQPASIADLEKELSDLWRSAAEDPGTKHPVMRASVLTLLVYVEDEQAGRETLDLISKVIAQNPCRAIIMIAEENERPEGLTSWISAQCHLPASGARQVCCEQICIHARGGAVRGLDNVVIPLAIPELPVFLWWRAGRFSPPSFLDPILRVANRVLVDAAEFEEPESDLAALARQMERFRGAKEVAFSDLNWARLTPYRELIAQCFDFAGANAYLNNLAEVKMEWTEQPGSPDRRTQMLLLAAWLATRLGWQPTSRLEPAAGRARPLEFQKDGQPVRVELVPRSKVSKSPHALAITMRTGGERAAQFSITESEEEGNVLTRAEIPGCPPRERTIRLQVLNQIGLVNEELKFPGRDRIYERSLSLLAGMFKG